MNRFVTLTTIALLLAPAGQALAKDDKGKGKDHKRNARIELSCPPGLAKQGRCHGDAKVKIKTKHKGDKSKIKIEVKNDDGDKRKIEIKGATANRILEGVLAPDRPRLPVVTATPNPPAAIPPASVAPVVSPAPEPRRVTVNRTQTTTLDSTETARTTSTTTTRDVTLPAAQPSILAPTTAERSATRTTQTSVERTDDGTSAKFVSNSVTSVTLADGRKLGVGDRFEDAYKNDYVVLRNPEMFNLPPLSTDRNYVRVGDTAVVIDGNSQEVMDFVTIAGLLIE